MRQSGPSAYDEIGGNPTVKAAVTVFYNRVLADSDLAPWFEGVDLGRLKAHQRAFLTMALAGPHLFAGRDLGQAHAGMAITGTAFDSIVAHLGTALADVGVDEVAISTVLQRIEAQRPLIVTS